MLPDPEEDPDPEELAERLELLLELELEELAWWPPPGPSFSGPVPGSLPAHA